MILNPLENLFGVWVIYIYPLSPEAEIAIRRTGVVWAIDRYPGGMAVVTLDADDQDAAKTGYQAVTDAIEGANDDQ